MSTRLGLFDFGDEEGGIRPTQALHAPFAERRRPASIDQVIGQKHLLGDGKPLRGLLSKGFIPSIILWGPPGVGKTTLARLIVEHINAEFISLSAVMSGVKDLRQAVIKASEIQQLGRKTILFIDEIHRFNKAQQDALLPHIESGLVTFIGATTENPSFEVNSALLSRSEVFVLQALTESELIELGKNAQTDLPLHFSVEAIRMIASTADGDARRMLNCMEQVAMLAAHNQAKAVEAAHVKEALGSSVRRFDKGGDNFYDQISALHKSVRGSDPDAALYWFCRMLDGGTDIKYLSRRIVRMAWEDIGLADPRAMTIAGEAAATYERLGSPEGDLALAEAVIYLSVAPKSNAAYKAFGKAMELAKSKGSLPVPLHLRNAPTKLLRELGHGEGYRYSQDDPEGYSAGQSYWPDNLEPKRLYEPTERGLEIKIREKLQRLSSQNSPVNKI